MVSVLGPPTTITLNATDANEIVLDAPSTGVLNITGTNPGGVDLTGISNIELISGGQWNKGTPLSGQCLAFSAGQVTNAIRWASFGNGEVYNGGLVMPVDGTIVAWSLGSAVNETITVEYYLNRVATGITISLAAAQTTSAFITEAFVAGDEIGVFLTNTGTGDSYNVTFFIRFD